MKLKIKLRKLTESRVSLQMLADMELDLSPSFRIARTIEAFNDVMESFDFARNKVFKRYFKVRPDAENPKGTYNEGFTEEALREELAALDEEVVELEVSQVRKNRLTRNGELISVKPAVLAGVTWLIIDDEPEEEPQ